MKLVAGNSNRALAEAIAAYLNIPLGKCLVRRFADMEVFVEIQENVRGEDVFVLQSTSFPANDHLMELLIMLDACRRASAARITAVIPYFGYARQDRKDSGRVPITSKMVANLIVNAGAHRVLTMDLHAAQIQGFFDVPVSPVAYADLKFDHPDKRARLPLQLHEEPPSPKKYPLRLLTLAPKKTLQSQMLPEDQQGVPRVWVAPDCPALKEVDLGAPIYLSSPLGRIHVDVKLMEGLHPGAVLYRRGDWMAMGGGINQLISDVATNIGGGTAFYGQYVRLENK